MGSGDDAWLIVPINPRAPKPLFLFVETYGIEMRNPVAKDITNVSEFESDCRLGAIAASLALHIPKYLETASDPFETFNVPAMYVAMQAVLSPFTLRSKTSIVIEMDFCDASSHTVSPLRGVAKPRTLLVNSYRTEMGSLTADYITYVLKIEFRYRPGAEVPRDGSYCGRELFAEDSRKLFDRLLLFTHAVWIKICLVDQSWCPVVLQMLPG